MASRGICDRVAIVGMGCTSFGEHWDKGADDMLVESTQEAFKSANVTKDQVDAYWLGTMGSGVSGLVLSEAIKI
ncbi:MAG TPA: acetyl-CoA acetyltransferase, partial [Myxococcota bacterium]|nr:acetyl-CoA acetyltransferase [Myxococcota bacterium]